MTELPSSYKKEDVDPFLKEIVEKEKDAIIEEYQKSIYLSPENAQIILPYISAEKDKLEKRSIEAYEKYKKSESDYIFCVQDWKDKCQIFENSVQDIGVLEKENEEKIKICSRNLKTVDSAIAILQEELPFVIQKKTLSSTDSLEFRKEFIDSEIIVDNLERNIKFQNSKKENLDNEYTYLKRIKSNICEFNTARKDFIDLPYNEYYKKYEIDKCITIFKLNQMLVDCENTLKDSTIAEQCYLQKEIDSINRQINNKGKVGNYYFLFSNEGPVILSKIKMEDQEKEMIKDKEKLIQISKMLSPIESLFNILSKEKGLLE